MKLYSYETNIFYNSGLIIPLIGNTKNTIEKYFKDLKVKVGKRRGTVNPSLYSKYETVEEVLKVQKDILQKLLKLKQCSIKEVEQCQK